MLYEVVGLLQVRSRSLSVGLTLNLHRRDPTFYEGGGKRNVTSRSERSVLC